MKYKILILIFNQKNKTKILLIVAFVIFYSSCATRNIEYDRYKILKKYSKAYKILLDNQEINLETVIIDKNNIKNVRIDKRKQEVSISQFKPGEFVKLNDLILDSLIAGQKKIEKNKTMLVVIDGVPQIDSLIERTKIDLNSIKQFEILTKEELGKNEIFCRPVKYLLIIKTE